MKQENKHSNISIECGKTTNTLEELKVLCQAEAENLLKSIDFVNKDSISVQFWTSDFPELICVGKFSKTENGSVKYDLDFSESTL